MDSAPLLTTRHQQVLQATVRHYIATAEPVGSRALTQEYNLKVSPATVRNTMGWLEKYGFLYQPHTSAGRVPSDWGYRLYVDRLMQSSGKLARQVDTMLSEELGWAGWSLEALLKEATQILAQVTGYLALVTLPQASTALIRHIQLVQVEGGQLLVIVLLDCLSTESILVPLRDWHRPGATDTLGGSQLEMLSNFLTHHLQGRPLVDVAQLDWSALGEDFQRYGVMLGRALEELARRSRITMSTQLVVSGLAEVLRQPEFADAQHIQAIIRLLEQGQAQLWPLLFEAPPITPQAGPKDVRVWIGSENPIEPMQGCALVVSCYRRQSNALGSVGVLGPTRMVYENAVEVVKATADYLSHTLSPEVEAS